MQEPGRDCIPVAVGIQAGPMPKRKSLFLLYSILFLMANSLLSEPAVRPDRSFLPRRLRIAEPGGGTVSVLQPSQVQGRKITWQADFQTAAGSGAFNRTLRPWDLERRFGAVPRHGRTRRGSGGGCFLGKMGALPCKAAQNVELVLDRPGAPILGLGRDGRGNARHLGQSLSRATGRGRGEFPADTSTLGPMA